MLESRSVPCLAVAEEEWLKRSQHIPTVPPSIFSTIVFPNYALRYRLAVHAIEISLLWSRYSLKHNLLAILAVHCPPTRSADLSFCRPIAAQLTLLPSTMLTHKSDLLLSHVVENTLDYTFNGV